MTTKRELIEENEQLLDFIGDLRDRVDDPEIQDEIDEFLGDDADVCEEE